MPFVTDIMAAVLLGELVPLGLGLPIGVGTHFRFVIMGQLLVGLTAFPVDLVLTRLLHLYYNQSYLLVMTLTL